MTRTFFLKSLSAREQISKHCLIASHSCRDHDRLCTFSDIDCVFGMCQRVTKSSVISLLDINMTQSRKLVRLYAIRPVNFKTSCWKPLHMSPHYNIYRFRSDILTLEFDCMSSIRGDSTVPNASSSSRRSRTRSGFERKISTVLQSEKLD